MANVIQCDRKGCDTVSDVIEGWFYHSVITENGGGKLDLCGVHQQAVIDFLSNFQISDK